MISGDVADRHGWLFPVPPAVPAARLRRDFGDSREPREPGEVLAAVGQPGHGSAD